MLRYLRNPITLALLAGTVLGVVLALVAEQVDHYTSTDEFCTSCHGMQAYIADSETYKTSTHQTTNSGVRPGCGDCHIPKGLVAATWTHVVAGAGDVYAEARFDWKDPKVWEERKQHLAFATRMWMRGNDSVTCRGCHEESSIKPQKTRGKRQHEEALERRMTCIDCHYNIVHDPIEPSDEFLAAAEKGG